MCQYNVHFLGRKHFYVSISQSKTLFFQKQVVLLSKAFIKCSQFQDKTITIESEVMKVTWRTSWTSLKGANDFSGFFSPKWNQSLIDPHICTQLIGNNHSYLYFVNDNFVFSAFIILKNLYVNQLYILDGNFHYISFFKYLYSQWIIVIFYDYKFSYRQF